MAPTAHGRDRGVALRERLTAYGLLLSGALGIVLAYWPGSLDADSLGTIATVRTGLIIDQLSPVLSWVWRQAYRVTGVGPGVILAVQTAVLTVGLYLLLRAAFERVAASALTVLALLAPPTFGLIGLVGRDAWFVSSCLLATGLGAGALRWSGRPRTAATAVAVLAAFVAVAARQNGFTAVAPIMVGLMAPVVGGLGGRWAWIARRRRLSALALGVGLTLVMLAATVVAATVVRDRSSHPEINTYLYDLGYLTIEENRRFIPPLPREVQPFQTVEEVKARWFPTTGVHLRLPRADSVDMSSWLRDPRQRVIYVRKRDSAGVLGPPEAVRLGYGDDNAERLGAAWRSAVLDHPGTYLAGRLALWRRLIGIGAPPLGATTREGLPNPFGYTAPSFPVLSDAARGWTRRWANPSTLRGSAVHRVWPYLLVCLLGLVLLLPRFSGPVRMVGILMAAVVGLQAGLVFMPPAVELRFQLLTLYAAMIALAVGARSIQRGRPSGYGSVILSDPRGRG